MNNRIKNEARVMNRSLIEAATTVFKPAGSHQYKAVKSRTGDVIIGATYSEPFVKAYALENINVYIDMGGGR